MIGKKVVLTYKRKRFSSQTHHGNRITADSNSKSPTNGVPLEISSQEAESGTDNEKLKKDNATADVGKDAGVESAPEGGAETKNAGDTGDKLSVKGPDIPEKPNLGHQHSLPSQLAGHVPEDPSGKLAAARTTDVIRDPILVHECRGSDLSGNKLADIIKSSEKATTLRGVSKDRSHLSDLEFSAVPTASASLTKIESRKSAFNVMPENILESQSSSSRSFGIVMADKKTDGKVELGWLETLDKELKDTNKGKNICSSWEQSVINCKQAANGKASSILPVSSSMQSQHDQDALRELGNQMTGSQQRAFLTKSLETGFERQQHGGTNKSSFSTGILGLPFNLEGPDVSVKNFQIMRPSLNFSIKETVNEYNKQPPWPSIDENASVPKPKQIVDHVLSDLWMLEERQAPLLDKFKRNTNEWSEEELDFLWIGVRRYGINNWNAMLRDPKLCFMKSRVADDLAERWNMEQRKILNGALLQPGRISGPELSLPPLMNDSWLAKPAPSNHYGGNGAWSECSELPMLTAEPKLSLGGIYLQDENTSKRNPLHAIGQGTANALTSVSLSTDSIAGNFPVGSYTGSGINYLKSFNAYNTRYDCESSSSHEKSVEMLTQDHQPTSLPASSNLPHWLRDVVISQPKPGNSTLPAVSALTHSASMLNNDSRIDPPAQPKDPRGRGILKRKSTSDNHASNLRVLDNPVSTNEHRMGRRPGVLPTPVVNSQTPTSANAGSSLNGAFDLNKKNSGPVGPSNLVVIDSDASSEKTISDS